VSNDNNRQTKHIILALPFIANQQPLGRRIMSDAPDQFNHPQKQIVDKFDEVQQQLKDFKERKAAGIPPIPRRPLTAYNIFSIMERHYILQQHDKTVDPSEAVDTPDEANDTKFEDPYLATRPAKYKDVKLPSNWYIVGMNRKKRQQHKCHGVISFKALSKMISDAWNTSPDEVKAYCKMISTEELKKYRDEQKTFKETYGEEAFEAQTRKRKNAEAVEAGLSKGRKCHKKEREKAAAAAAAKAKSESAQEDAAAKPSLMGGPMAGLSPKQNVGPQNGLMGLMGQSNNFMGSDMQGMQSRMMGPMPGYPQMQGYNGWYMGGGGMPNSFFPQDMQGNNMSGMGDMSAMGMQGPYSSMAGFAGGGMYSSMNFQDQELMAMRSRMLERELLERAMAERAMRERALAQHQFNQEQGQQGMGMPGSGQGDMGMAQQSNNGAPSSVNNPASVQEAWVGNPEAVNQVPNSASASAPHAESNTTAAAKEETSPEAPNAPPIKAETKDGEKGANGSLRDGERSAVLGLLGFGKNEEQIPM
jgi:hypothetical protein